MIDGNEQDAAFRGVSVAVFGAAGFIGRWVAYALARRGAEVYAIVRDVAAARKIFERLGVREVHFAELDLQNSAGLPDFFAANQPSVTFNLAGYGVDPTERDEATAYRINAELVQVIAENIAATNGNNAHRDAVDVWQGQQIVHVGSALEYGTTGGDLAEDGATNPTTLYGKSKLAGTQNLARTCAARGIKGVTARLFTVYGDGEHAGRLLPALLETKRTLTPLKLTDGLQRRDFTYVEDVAEGLLRLALTRHATPGEVVNLATGVLTSVREFAEIAARVLRIPHDKLEFGAVSTRPEEMMHADVTVERMRRLTGWGASVSIEDGVRRTLERSEAQTRRNADF